ncbi:MAG TPA: flagella basal body P-ring formation protein FlgA [Granulicella sp.]|jgi:hypothetical protein|nr:flagella basal body P-ring formation protein FlgA [Granulicella sp.]
MTSPAPTRQTAATLRRRAVLGAGCCFGIGLFAAWGPIGSAQSAFPSSPSRARSSVDANTGANAEANAAQRESLSAQGWVLREVHWDPILRHAWEVFADPAHPERPTVAVLADGAQQELARGAAEERSRAIAAAVPVVRIGDRVMLWSTEKNLRLQLAAVAEENGALGDHIRLRIPGAAWDNGANSQQSVRGVVRSATDVEMEP